VPDELTIKLNIRFNYSRSREKTLEKLNKYGKLENIHEDPIYNVDRNNLLVKKYIELAKEEFREIKFETSAGATDAVYFNDTPVILHRPNGGGQHSEEEWLDMESMKRFNKLIKKFIESIL
jgi:acetylornithine deacetylase/succinyl-diaminopimelate desuccinylase-like protein